MLAGERVVIRNAFLCCVVARKHVLEDEAAFHRRQVGADGVGVRAFARGVVTRVRRVGGLFASRGSTCFLVVVTADGREDAPWEVDGRADASWEVDCCANASWEVDSHENSPFIVILIIIDLFWCQRFRISSVKIS